MARALWTDDAAMRPAPEEPFEDEGRGVTNHAAAISAVR
jgi:hypothetical protein